MRYLGLLCLVGLILLVISIPTTDDYSVSVTGPPANGLPELFFGNRDHPISVPRDILESKTSGRSLVYQFHLSSGTYDHLRWNGHGVPLSATLSVRDYWGREVATLQASQGDSDELLTSSNGPLILPSPGVFSILRWLATTLALWIFCVLLFFIGQSPLAAWARRLLATPPHQPPRRILDGRIVLLTILALGAVWLSLAVPGAIRFDVGDDPAMEMLSCGYVTGHPSEYLVFINVLIGLFLKGLYVLAPSAPWYPLLILATTIFCLVGITSFLLRDDRPDRFCWLCLFGVVFGTYFVTHLQFTSAAYLLGLFGMLLFSLGQSRSSLVAAVMLISMGSLLRFEAFLLLLVTTAGAAWFLSQRKVIDKAIFFAAILFLGSVGTTFDHSYYNRDADWRAYRQYNVARGDLHMTPKLNFSDKNQPVFEHVGWSKNDFAMFKDHWLFEDSAAFSIDKLTYLDQHLASDRSGLDLLVNLLVAIVAAPAAALVFLVILFHRLERPGRSWLMLAVIIGPLLFVGADLAFNARLPARVAVPVFYAACLFLLVATRGNGEICRRLSSTRALPLLFITLGVLALTGMWKNAQQNDRAEKRIVTSLAYLAPYPGQALIGSINAVPLESLAPLTALVETQNAHIIHLMWSGGSPSFALQLQRHGSASLFQSLASGPKFWLLIPTSQWDRAASFTLYMQEHYHQQIKMVPVILADGQSAVFPDFTVMKAVPDTQP